MIRSSRPNDPMSGPDQDPPTPAAEEGSPAEAYVSAPSELTETAPLRQLDQALLQRPVFGIRAQLTLAFSLLYVLCTVIALWNLYTVSKLQEQLRFLEVCDSTLSSIQQARRFEKDYLLYGTNLEDTRRHAESATAIIDTHRDAMARVVAPEEVSAVVEHLSKYKILLRQLGEATETVETKRIDPQLREHGAAMVSFALKLSQNQRQLVDRTFRLAQRVPFVFLGVMLLAMLLITVFLSRQLLQSFSRFTTYAKRIGQGDFSPIGPVRKYRDEFSQLALTFNRMIEEIDHRHEILVESHKLRAIGDLVAGVAHELNNPLNNIFLTASTLLEDYAELATEERTEMAEDVMKEAERARCIVRNLLDFARESEIQIKPMLLDEVLRDAMALVGNQLKMAKITSSLEVPPGLPPVHGDSQMLTQVIVNLVLNAIDALPAQGSLDVTVRSDLEDEYVAIVLHDDGPGIPAPILPRVFEPFFTTKKKGRGTGLGLSVSAGIVRKLGGMIRVASGPETGTTFTVLLPKTDIPFEGNC